MLPFEKYEGLGNDFVVLDAEIWPESWVGPALAQALCDRHTGIGADGILWFEHHHANQEPRLAIYNSDGSRPEMCGNGVRCLAAYLGEHEKLHAGETVNLQTDAGARRLSLVSRDAAGVFSVDVAMGEITVLPAVLLAFGQRTIRVVPVDAGNPHAVIFEAIDIAERMDVVRAVEANRAQWPDGVNVEFVRTVISDPNAPAAFDVAVHERGAGWTQACGTGACAVATAAVTEALDGVTVGQPVQVNLPGGGLEILVLRQHDRFQVKMRGPARRAFCGTVARPRVEK